MLLKPLDFGILVFAFGAVLASFFAVYSGSGGQYTINVKGSDGEWIFPSDAAETVTAAGPLGDTLVEIRNGQARVLSSPCVNQTCVAAGAIHSPGQWAACLPNRVMVFISESSGGTGPAQRPADGSGENGVDAAAW